ncbi:MAG: hypothetical protein JWM81_28 [Candidatus Saccharibacteria bacterium]|nr:hypothetical protein [Candidatus Saccharibacteria bacterium]
MRRVANYANQSEVGGRAPRKLGPKLFAASTLLCMLAACGSSKAAPSEAPTAAAPPVATASPTPSATPPAEAPYQTGLQIVGNADCQRDTTAAIDLLKQKDPLVYQSVSHYVGRVVCQKDQSGMHAYEQPPTYHVGDATRTAGTIWYAGTIAHDTEHAKLYEDYMAQHPGVLIPNDIWTGQDAEATCLAVQADTLTHLGAPQYMIDSVNNALSTNYFNIPLDQRWW